MHSDLFLLSAFIAWFPTGYNINRHLGQYFDDPASFRRLQATTGTLISGSNALQFFERILYPNSDMDLYVDCKYLVEVATWLEEHGYVFQPTARQLENIYMLDPHATYPEVLHGVVGGIQIAGTVVGNFLRWLVHRNGSDIGPMGDLETYGLSGIKTVLRFLNKEESTDGRTRQKVDVIIAQSDMSPLGCILNFHSTLVMNFIAYDAAYSLFPNATFLHRTCLTFGIIRNGVFREVVHAKYWDRGFRISAQPLPVAPKVAPSHSDPDTFIDQETGIRFGERFVGDEHVWRIRLDTRNLLNKDEAEKARLYSECLRNNGFNLLSRSIQHSGTFYRNPGSLFYTKDANHPVLFFKVISSTVLERNFVLPLRDYAEIQDFLGAQERLEAQFLVSLRIERQKGEEENMATNKRSWDIDVLKMIQKVLSTKPKPLLSYQLVNGPNAPHQSLRAIWENILES